MKSYFIKFDNGILKEYEEYESVLIELKALTLKWCLSPDYSGKSWEELYQWCLENKNFGDIAQVYETGWSDLYLSKVNSIVPLKRIL